LGSEPISTSHRVTTTQQLLGHKRLNSTMIYARVHDRTVAGDYNAATEVMEKRLQVTPSKDVADPPVNDDERAHLLELATQLAELTLGVDVRLHLVERMRRVLNLRTPTEQRQPTESKTGRRSRASP
jgi:hypothetical protein